MPHIVANNSSPLTGANLTLLQTMNKYSITFGQPEDEESVTMKLEAVSVENAISQLSEIWETEFITNIQQIEK